MMTPAKWTEFVETSSIKPFAWGRADCLLDLADWLMLVTGRDYGAKWRGTYSDADQCRALFRRDGGIVNVLRRDMAAAGLVETTVPKAGDVALVKAFAVTVSGRRLAVFPMGAVMAPSGRWRVRAIVGHLFQSYPVIVAWERPCQP